MGLEISNIETKDKVFHISDHQKFLKDEIESIRTKEIVLMEFINVLNKCLSQYVVLLVKGN